MGHAPLWQAYHVTKGGVIGQILPAILRSDTAISHYKTLNYGYTKLLNILHTEILSDHVTSDPNLWSMSYL